jgi:hypothetical protein
VIWIRYEVRRLALHIKGVWGHGCKRVWDLASGIWSLGWELRSSFRDCAIAAQHTGKRLY